MEVGAKWGRETKITFAAHKTQAMLITRRLKYEEPTFVVDSVPLALSSEIKLLELTIDKAHSFRTHITNITTKAISLYKAVTKMAKSQWGLNADIVRTIYKIVEPTILYAAGAWGDVAEREYVKERLNRVTRAFSVPITKAHRTVSVMS